MIPTAEQIRAARRAANLTQLRAALLVGAKSLRTWQAWEYGQNPMPAGMWELFKIKVSKR